jgi:molybdate transport system substrate-binding protein
MKWLILILLFTSCLENNDQTIRIAVAANMQIAAEDLAEEFTFQTNIKTEVISGSSGKLAAQILAGAPFDVFLAANMNYAQAVYEGGKAESKPRNYATGKLVLWSAIDDIKPIFTALSSKEINTIAIANPRTAPYGQAGKEVLENLKIYEQVKGKLVFGESISQTNQFILSKAAQIGFTSKSSVLSETNWIEINDTLYSSMKQGMIIIKQSNEKMKLAHLFEEFLFSKKASEILIANGYILNE